MPANPARVALLLMPLFLLLSACSPPLSGRYEDVNDPARYYTFSKWTRTWESYYDDSGRYEVDGQRIQFDASGGISGEIISPDEFRLDDVPGFNEARPYNIYRRRPQ
jgi:hypothetical protein